MSEQQAVFVVAQKIFRGLAEEGMCCVILHHFDFEEGGDIDFCVDVSGLEVFLRALKRLLGDQGWEVIQVFPHEQSGAYVVCRDSGGGGRYLLFDYCQDYRIRGHKILSCSEMLTDSKSLQWGGRGSDGFIELAYRFVKAAVKRKNASVITHELRDLWDCHGEQLDSWLRGRWGLEVRVWDESSVARVLDQLRGRLRKRNWSLAELVLKLKRLFKPRGLWVECSVGQQAAMIEEVRPCFRSVREGRGSLLSVLGSAFIIEKEGGTSPWKRKVLKLVNCWLEVSSGEEVVQFLMERNAKYQKWK
jgi:hypothetical protein